ncbi:MAG: tetratricopeptide repeat protein [Planctomycetota bacterium]
MEIRKEQVLFAGTLLLLGLFVATAGREDVGKAPRGPAKDMPAATETPVVVTDGAHDVKTSVRDLFVEPSDIAPLPPLEAPELVLPPFPVLELVIPPVHPGVDPEHWYLRRMPVDRIRELGSGLAQAAAAGNGGDGEMAEAAAEGQGQGDVIAQAPAAGQEAKEAAWGQRFDRILLRSQSKPLWGKVLGQAPHSLGTPDPAELLRVRGPFTAAGMIELRWVRPETGSVTMERRKWEADQLGDIEAIVFADTITNRIGMRERRIPAGDSGLPDREQLVYHLLLTEREFPEAFAAAEKQALQYIEINKASSRGYELLAHVYSLTGQLDKELALYRELLQGPMREQPFVLRGLGTLEARLGMDEQAEDHLRQAVRLDSSDGASHWALGRFLLDHGRAAEADKESEAAVKNLPIGLREVEAFAIHALRIRTLLALGRPDEAAASLAPAGGYTGGDPEYPLLVLLDGAVAYAQERFEDAERRFLLASTGLPDTVDTAIGQAMASFRRGNAGDAMQILEGGLARDPLERYRVRAVRGFMLAAGGKLEEGVTELRAAQGMAPRDPYVLYLLGRYLSQSQVFDEADDLYEAILRRHSGIVEVMAEFAHLLLKQAMASSDPAQALAHLTRAERFARKVCEVEEGRGRSWKYQDLLGVIRYRLRNNEGAREAFRRSKEWGGDGTHADIYLALLDYRAGRTDECLAKLTRLRQNLRADDPFHGWLTATIDELRWHASLRLFGDRFGRDGEPRNRWQPLARALKVNQRAGEAVLKGRSLGTVAGLRYLMEKGTTSVVEVRTRMRLGSNHSGTFAGLRLTNERIGPGARKTQNHFEYRIGFEDGLRVQAIEGTTQNTKLPDLREKRGDFKELGVSFKPGETHELGFRIERPKREGDTGQAEVVFLFDGREVARCKSGRLSYGAGTELFVDLYADGEKALDFDVAFDDFSLVFTE